MGVSFLGRNPKFYILIMAFYCHTMCHTFSVFRVLRIESQELVESILSSLTVSVTPVFAGVLIKTELSM
jgi:ABC-type uncharacterized transport system permease subunit